MSAPARVAFLPADAARDGAAMASLAEMVNAVYTVADTGLWTEPFHRTNPDELVRHTRDGELAVARVDSRVVGCVRVRMVDDATAEFGLLAADSSQRGTGIGRELVRFAEQTARATGRTVMELELMAPRDGPHPAKDFLAAWYGRLGYRFVGQNDLATVHPGLGPRLARPCDFRRYRKDL
ncbi:GNAT family N-acetyltransferase [Pseudonocardia endophytica]|uniref:Acetyltransferase (GNAT) family protein n=1 Tax=Pseudonocardia endophytica TaxID=401976 RepID=A0A4R1HW69_PSEEN|nr:GNAT family N-acetyltransferase [Pseudonocardia endophytica]TCK26994.1 acetyltransferase (GNAT) family protein [Pseudonocardia endophytica]